MLMLCVALSTILLHTSSGRQRCRWQGWSPRGPAAFAVIQHVGHQRRVHDVQVLFAVPRIAGYLSHWRESLSDKDVRIARPQQDYRGVWLRDLPAESSRPAAPTGPDGVVETNEHKRKAAGAGWL